MADLPRPPRDVFGEVLEYVAASGAAALVRLPTGTVLRAAGGLTYDWERFRQAAERADFSERTVVQLDDGLVVGRAGLQHALVLDLCEELTDPLSAVSRVQRACQTLARFLPPVEMAAGDEVPPMPSTPNDSGAPAHAVVFPPQGKKPDPSDSS